MYSAVYQKKPMAEHFNQIFVFLVGGGAGAVGSNFTTVRGALSGVTDPSVSC